MRVHPFLTAAVVILSCNSPGNRCVPGQAVACVCADLRSGVQVCDSGGTYERCDCSGAASDGGSRNDGGIWQDGGMRDAGVQDGGALADTRTFRVLFRQQRLCLLGCREAGITTLAFSYEGFGNVAAINVPCSDDNTYQVPAPAGPFRVQVFGYEGASRRCYQGKRHVRSPLSGEPVYLETVNPSGASSGCKTFRTTRDTPVPFGAVRIENYDVPVAAGVTNFRASLNLAQPARSCTWSFGDGTSPTPGTLADGGCVASHRFETEGCRVVSVSVSDTTGLNTTDAVVHSVANAPSPSVLPLSIAPFIAYMTPAFELEATGVRLGPQHSCMIDLGTDRHNFEYGRSGACSFLRSPTEAKLGSATAHVSVYTSSQYVGRGTILVTTGPDLQSGGADLVVSPGSFAWAAPINGTNHRPLEPISFSVVIRNDGLQQCDNAKGVLVGRAISEGPAGQSLESIEGYLGGISLSPGGQGVYRGSVNLRAGTYQFRLMLDSDGVCAESNKENNAVDVGQLVVRE